MPLIECPDCGKQISDAARHCIHCGRPFEPREKVPTTASSSAPPQLLTELLARAKEARPDDAELPAIRGELLVRGFKEEGVPRSGKGVAADSADNAEFAVEAARSVPEDRIVSTRPTFQKVRTPLSVSTPVVWIGAIIISLLLSHDGRGSQTLSISVGRTVGMVIGQVALAGLILGWRPRTRRRMWPLGVVVLSAAMWVATTREGRVNAAERTSQVDSLQADIGAMAFHAEAAPPADELARQVWVSRASLQDLQKAFQSLAAENRVDIDNLPSEYLKPSYLSNARARPDVKIYFTRYSEYLRQAVARYEVLMDSIVTHRVEQAGLSAATERRVREDIMTGVREAGGPEALRLNQTFVLTALELHSFLESADARISIDPADGLLTFERPSELARFNELHERLLTASSAVAARQELARRRMSSNADSMRQLVDPKQ